VPRPPQRVHALASKACAHAGPARITGRIARKKTERIELKCQDETKQCRPAVAQAPGKGWEDADLQLVVAAGVAERVPVENACVRAVEKRLLIRREFPVSIRNARSAEH